VATQLYEQEMAFLFNICCGVPHQCSGTLHSHDGPDADAWVFFPLTFPLDTELWKCYTGAVLADCDAESDDQTAIFDTSSKSHGAFYFAACVIPYSNTITLLTLANDKRWIQARVHVLYLFTCRWGYILKPYDRQTLLTLPQLQHRPNKSKRHYESE